MPQKHCCLAFCRSTEREGAVLHYFPNPMSDPERFKTWITNSGLLGEADKYIYKNRRICYLHFEEIYKYPNNRLAIPTLHMPGTALGELEHIDPEQPLLAQPVLAGITVSAKSGVTRESIPMMLNDPQPSTSSNIHTAVSFFMDNIFHLGLVQGNNYNILHSINIIYDESDPIKMLAYAHFSKTRGRVGCRR